jgi:Tol biopolymer transport system component
MPSRLSAVLVLSLYLVFVPVAPSQAAFPGTNGLIAFTEYHGGDNYEIYTMNPDGSGQKRITNYEANDVAEEWSPDGTKLAFTSGRGDRST